MESEASWFRLKPLDGCSTKERAEASLGRHCLQAVIDLWAFGLGTAGPALVFGFVVLSLVLCPVSIPVFAWIRRRNDRLRVAAMNEKRDHE